MCHNMKDKMEKIFQEHKKNSLSVHKAKINEAFNAFGQNLFGLSTDNLIFIGKMSSVFGLTLSWTQLWALYNSSTTDPEKVPLAALTLVTSVVLLLHSAGWKGLLPELRRAEVNVPRIQMTVTVLSYICGLVEILGLSSLILYLLLVSTKTPLIILYTICLSLSVTMSGLKMVSVVTHDNVLLKIYMKCCEVLLLPSILSMVLVVGWEAGTSMQLWTGVRGLLALLLTSLHHLEDTGLTLLLLITRLEVRCEVKISFVIDHLLSERVKV